MRILEIHHLSLIYINRVTLQRGTKYRFFCKEINCEHRFFCKEINCELIALGRQSLLVLNTFFSHSKNPRVRTLSFKNLLTEFCHFNTQKIQEPI